MHTHRVAVKLYLREGARLDPREAVAVFHGFIRDRRLEGEIPVDVADYSHMHRGPGVVLVCHAADLALDELDGRRGLLYRRKRDPIEAGFEGRLLQAARSALGVARMLEREPALEGRARFSGRELVVRAYDRLLAPNTSATFADAKPVLDAVSRRLWPGAAVEIAHLADPAECFAVRLVSSEDAEVATLLARLDRA